MFWVPFCVGILNAWFMIDFLVTICTGESMAKLIVGKDNALVSTITENIPTDPVQFWICSALIIVFVCIVECIAIYIAFYSDRSECYCDSKCGVKK